MIVVAGAGRCGTSLMMQTLGLLGVPLLGNPVGHRGHQLWQNYQNINNLILDDIPKDKNPKGYFELPLEIVYDVIKGDYPDHKGKAVKITAPEVTHIDPKNIDAVILCVRSNIKDAARSMYELALQDHKFALLNGLSHCFAEMYGDVSIEDWENHMIDYNETVQKWLDKKLIKSTIVYFEDMVTDPEPIIQHLGDFCNLDDPNISAALKNVDKR